MRSLRPEPAARVAVFSRVRDRLAAVPGVEEAGLASMALSGTRFTDLGTPGGLTLGRA